MDGLKRYCAFLLTVLLVVGAGGIWAATIEVSQPNSVTANSAYDRNPSIIHDGTFYWLFYTKGDDTSTGGVRGVSYNPDGDTYVLFYKRAATIAGLAGEAETKLSLSESARPANFDQRVVCATYFGGKIYAFVSSGQSGTNRGLYYYEYSGGSWGGPMTLIADTGVPNRGGHVNVTSDGSRVYIVWECSDGTADAYTWDGATLSSKIDVSNDNMPKITLMGTTLYVVSIEDGTGDIEVHSAASGASPSFTGHSTAIAGAGLYDPCIFHDGTNLYVISAPYDGGDDRQWLLQSIYSGGWAAAKTIGYGGYGTTYWWDYWPVGYHDGSDAYVFFTTETASPTYSDGEIAYVKMDWNPGNDHYFHIQNAIDQASSGDVINVATGSYTENLSIYKELTLQGYSMPTLTGHHTVTDNNVTIDGFAFVPASYGITIDATAGSISNVIITNNVFTLSGYGGVHIGGDAGSANLISNVTMSHNTFDGPVSKAANPWKIGGFYGSPAGQAVTDVDFTENTVNRCSIPINLHDKNLTDILIKQNIFRDTDGVVYVWGDGPGGVLSQFVFEENDVDGSNTYGVVLGEDGVGAYTPFGDGNYGAGNKVYNNSLANIPGGYGYASVSLKTTGSHVLDASGNWYGSTDPATVGAAVSAGVDYTPWLGVGTDTDGGTMGFQGDFSTVWVDDSSPQTGAVNSIQEGIDMVTASTVIVAPGTYVMDFIINKNDVELTSSGGKTVTTIKGVSTLAWANWPLASPNIDLQANNVKIHGFTIESPEIPAADYSSGLVMTGTNNEIYDNDFVVQELTPASGAGGVCIQTYRSSTIPGSNIDGLNIHDNTFSGTPGGDYVAVYINHTATSAGVVTVRYNTFTGSPWQGVVTERSNVTIQDNQITRTSATAGRGIIVSDLGAPGPNPINGVSLTGNTISGFEYGLRTSSGQTLTSITVAGNTFNTNTVQVQDRANQLNIGDIWSDNTFDKAVGVSGSPTHNTIWSNIQSAIDDAGTLDGDTVIVAAGTYTENVVINKSVDLTGEDRTTTIIDGNNAGNTVTITASNVTLTGFTVKNGHNGGGNIWSPYGGVVVDGNGGTSALTNITIDNNSIENNAGNGVYVSAAGHGGTADNIQITNCDIFFNGGSTSFFGGISLTYGWFPGSGGPTGSCDGLSEPYDEWRRPMNILVEGCEIKNNVSTGYVYGVYVNGGKENTLRSNFIHDFSAKGLLIAASMPCTSIPSEYTTVENNEIYDNSQNGVKLLSWNSYNTFDGNKFYNNGHGYTGTNLARKYGFNFKDGDHNAITNNEFYGNALGGLYLWGNGDPSYTWYYTTDNTITGNIIKDHTAAGAQGVYVPAKAGNPNSGFLNAHINNNSITNNHTYGLENADATQDIDASGNWWGTNTPAGVAAEVSANVDYTPWLHSGADTDPGTAGFQGDFSSVWVDDSSPQTGSVGRIGEALSIVTGSTVYVAPGTYNETVILDDTTPDNLTLAASDPGNRPEITGGVLFDNATDDLDGLTLSSLVLKGDADPSSREAIIDMNNGAAVNNFTMDGCLLDGENVAVSANGANGRFGIVGNRFGGSWSVTNTEFQNILGWVVMDMDASYAGPPLGGNELPLTTVTFSNNSIHNCNGSVALRGNNASRTGTVNVLNNTWDTIGGNGGQAGIHWAALEVNNATHVTVQGNAINAVQQGDYGEGQAIQFWNVDLLDVQGNTIANNYQGIYLYSDGIGGSYCGTPGCPVPDGLISYNDIMANTDYGLKIEAAAAGGPLNAEFNCWGHYSGPYHPTLNPGGIGNGVSDNVDFIPWGCYDYPSLIITVDTELFEDGGGGGNVNVLNADGDGVVDPGDVLLGHILIENVGGEDVTGVEYSGVYEHTAIVIGSVTTTQGNVTKGNNPGDTTVVVDIGTIDADGTVLITYQVIIDDPLPPGVTAITHQGVVKSNELGFMPTEDIHTMDGVTRIVIGEPLLHAFISPELSIAKPDSQFEVCIEIDSATAEMEIISVYALLTFDGILLDSVKVPIFGTLLDSSGWDLKWHFFPGVLVDTLDMWLIGGGGAEPLVGAGSLVCWEFRVGEGAPPGDTTIIRFSKFWFNEGTPLVETENGYVTVNRSPEFITTFDDTTYLIEKHEYCFDIEAYDPDGDSLIMWSLLDPYPCDGAEPDTVYGRGTVAMEWCWTPPKPGTCDTLRDTLIVMSTFETGQPLYDTLTTVFVVYDNLVDIWWPDTVWHACGCIEVPLYIMQNLDYNECLDSLDIMSFDIILDYDPELLTVFEVGNEGLITEDWGAMQFRVEDGYIYVGMGGNRALSYCDPVPTPLIYVGFCVDEGAEVGDSAFLSVDHVKLNEGWPTSYWWNGSITVVDYTISGTITYCDNAFPIPDVEVKISQDWPALLYEDTVYTDAFGFYEVQNVQGCTDYCLTPQKHNLPGQVITSYDASLMLRSIVGLVGLSSCDSLAADVTFNGEISAFDASVLLKYIVTGYTDQPLIPEHHAGEWVFVPDHRCYSDLDSSSVDQDYVGIIIGDVSQNYPGDGPPKLVVSVGCQVSVPQVTGATGETIHLPISVEGAQGVFSADMEVRFDPQLLTAVDVDTTAWTAGFMSAHHVQDGVIRIALAGARKLQGDGEIAHLTFRVNPALREGLACPLELSVALNEGIVPETISTGMFTSARLVPETFALAQNYPNPFNPTTTIAYAVPFEPGLNDDGTLKVTLKVYNVLGQEVGTLVEEHLAPGYYTVQWDGQTGRGQELATGIYFYRMTAGRFTKTMKMVLLK
ncbi:MAG: right-handed parallel beta-helix repeat-containing protein [Gemmatimonadota bacterium]|nr:MAG: right-handed parallel beta-helix repeat-containing protein [Gemmatimonadota bacterium]